MKIEKFEDIIAWRKAQDLTFNIYYVFKNNKDYGFKDQIQRASVSIMNNIAEGFELHTNKEFIKFLYIAKGSCAEVRSMLYIAKRLEYVSEKEYSENIKLTLEISRLISGFIKTL
jgi:four helix bundle protein